MSAIRLATRGSPLAMWQAREVRSRLEATHPGLPVEIVEIRTTGDRDQSRRIEEISATGVFTKEVDEALLRGDADIAVHSLKDQVTTLPRGLRLGMVLARGPVEDALVSRTGERLADLPAGARVATGSLRRVAQLRRLRPDLELVGVRGNVETRLARLDEGHAEALVLARAGLERLGLGERITEILDVEHMLPAVSQGIVGVTCREGDSRVHERLAAADDPVTHSAARAERALLRELHGGCNVPAGGHAVVHQGRLHLRARVLSRDGQECVEGAMSDSVDGAEALGVALAGELARRGARELIVESRNASEPPA